VFPSKYKYRHEFFLENISSFWSISIAFNSCIRLSSSAFLIAASWVAFFFASSGVGCPEADFIGALIGLLVAVDDELALFLNVFTILDSVPAGELFILKLSFSTAYGLTTSGQDDNGLDTNENSTEESASRASRVSIILTN
jgi:hypothetical protein